MFLCFSLTDKSSTEIYPLSLHDALPISFIGACARVSWGRSCFSLQRWRRTGCSTRSPTAAGAWRSSGLLPARSEEHTSELQSRRDLVCRLLLEKKKLCCILAAECPLKSI